MASVLFDSYGDPIPRDLLDLLQEAGSSLERPISVQRAALEALVDRRPELLQTADPHLLQLRSFERAADGLPRVVGGLRRDRLMAHDATSTTWHGWWEDSGEQGAVRCLRPELQRDPVLIRRIERGVRAATGLRGLAPMRFQLHGPCPHVAYRLEGVQLASLLPAEDLTDPLLLIRWLATGLATLHALHARGLAMRALAAQQVLLGEQRATLVWLDPLGGQPNPRGDLSQLAASLLLLDPERHHPQVQLMEPWVAAPPASAEEASELLRRALADHLAASRHKLAMRGRTADRSARAARLYACARALQKALPPPSGRCVLRAGHDRVLYLVESEDGCVRGGAAAGVPPHGLLPLYTPSRGLDAPAARAMLRAWAQRDDGDMELRTATQQRWAGSDAAGEALTRWLSAASRLRRAQLMLAHRTRH